MIDERIEELAALYAVDLLEGDERAEFEAHLQRDPAVQALVREFRGISSHLSHTVSALPPPALKDRIMASVEKPSAASTPPPPDNVIRPATFTFLRFAPWAIAAGLAVVAAWTGQRYFTSRSEINLLRDRQGMTDVALQSMRQQLEAERIVTGKQLEALQVDLAGTTNQLAAARTQLAAANVDISERDRQLGETRTQLASIREQINEREARIAALTQRVDAMTGASADLGRQLGEAKDRVAKLIQEMLYQQEVANLKITVLASLAKNSPQALAVTFWDPAKQEGTLKVEGLPALLANQDYQLWIVDPQYPNPVDGGVFTVDPKTGEARISYKPGQPVKAVAAFAVTLERKGGVPKAEGPFMLLGK